MLLHASGSDVSDFWTPRLNFDVSEYVVGIPNVKAKSEEVMGWEFITTFTAANRPIMVLRHDIPYS